MAHEQDIPGYEDIHRDIAARLGAIGRGEAEATPETLRGIARQLQEVGEELRQRYNEPRIWANDLNAAESLMGSADRLEGARELARRECQITGIDLLHWSEGERTFQGEPKDYVRASRGEPYPIRTLEAEASDMLKNPEGATAERLATLSRCCYENYAYHMREGFGHRVWAPEENAGRLISECADRMRDKGRLLKGYLDSARSSLEDASLRQAKLIGKTRERTVPDVSAAISSVEGASRALERRRENARLPLNQTDRDLRHSNLI